MVGHVSTYFRPFKAKKRKSKNLTSLWRHYDVIWHFKNFNLIYRHLLMDTNPTSHELLLHLFQYCLNSVDKKRSTTTTTTTTTSSTTTTTKFRNRRFLTLNIFKTIQDNRLKFYIHGNNPNDFIETKFQVATTSASPFCRPSKMPILACFLILF